MRINQMTVAAAGLLVACAPLWAVSRYTIQAVTGPRGVAKDIGNDGTVVGYKGVTVNDEQAYAWRDGNIRMLDVVPGSSMYAAGVNDKGEVAGSAQGSADPPGMWKADGSFIAFAVAARGESYAINNLSEV